MAAPLSIGQRAGRYREAFGLRREEVAEAVGRSREWLRSLEGGGLQLDRYTMIHALADALGTDPGDLLLPPDSHGDPQLRRARRTVPALRRALLRVDLPPAAEPAQDRPAEADSLRRGVDEARRLQRDARYDDLGLLLPPLLDGLRGAAADTSGDDRAVVLYLLGETLHLASTLTRRLGRTDLAALAAAEALHAATATGDPLQITAADWLRAEVCAAVGAADEARALVAGGLDRLDGLLGRTGPDAAAGRGAGSDRALWSLWGMLHAVAAVLEAQRGRQAEAADHLAGAAGAAGRLGPPAADLLAPAPIAEFSAAEAAVHSVHAALELGEDLEALERIAAVDLTVLPRGRRARHGIDRARVHARAGDDYAALRELLAADRFAPQAVRAHPLVPELVLAAARRGRASTAADEAAAHLGVEL
ncbi:helix-turn-helix domain-containing protein [Kitasatospora sp. NPDC051914]|uniref:helix-turn-helix domain-containing protein n=1 Tax=Kitasatospora sp. NPDC051914 TaxID=3154945 RepID=UPI003417B083